MSIAKPFPLIASIIAIIIVAALIIPGLAKATLALLTLCAAWGAYESFRDRDVAPGLVFALSTLVIGFLAWSAA